MNNFIWGATAFAGWVVGLFFYRSWRMTRDRLFVLFAVAFWLMSVQWIALSIARAVLETQYYLYVLRLLAFVLIAVAILDKNRSTKSI